MENGNLKINLITMRMSNHARHSGYDRLIDYTNAQRVIGLEDLSLFSRALCKGLKPIIDRANLRWYHRNNFIAEYEAGKSWLTDRGQVFHYLYGENSYRYLSNLKSFSRPNSIVCTYHTPPERFCQVVMTKKHLKKIDAIVTVSTMQQAFFSKFVGRDRTFFVPHGIDIDYFKPAATVKEKNGRVACLFVGSHMRDVETLVEASQLLKKWNKQIDIIAVTAPRNKQIIEQSNNITLRMGVSDEELLELYQQSDMLLLPLLGATANNSILEALACGLPIISTELEGIKDYVTEESAILVGKQDAKALAETVIQIASDKGLRKNMCIACRDQAIKFQWKQVAEKMREIYQLVQN